MLINPCSFAQGRSSCALHDAPGAITLDFDRLGTPGLESAEARGRLSEAVGGRGTTMALDMGLPRRRSLTDKKSPPSARGRALPHFDTGINTFLKAPYVENLRPHRQV